MIDSYTYKLVEFQCSSASRKFLNQLAQALGKERSCVSVLFSEPKIPQLCEHQRTKANCEVSVLFSEPKIPQSLGRNERPIILYVSVLFSEPKIPQ